MIAASLIATTGVLTAPAVYVAIAALIAVHAVKPEEPDQLAARAVAGAPPARAT